MAVFERRYLKQEYQVIPQWLTMWGVPAQAHVIVKRTIVIVSLALGMGVFFLAAALKRGPSVTP